MKIRKLIALALASGLFLTVVTPAAPAAASVLAGPCAPGSTYDPACDVDHDGDVDIFDIQLTASHWNRRGTWVSDNGHDHLGQMWTGNNNRLAIQGSFGIPAVAPLVLTNSGPGDGLWITGAGFSGVTVSSAGTDGVYVGAAGNPFSQSSSALKNGFEVAGAENNGVQVGFAGSNGLRVDTAGGSGVEIVDAAGSGFRVLHAGFDGLQVFAADQDGLRIINAGGDGVQIDAAAFTGLRVDAAGYDAITANTLSPDGDWGLYTPDMISASNINFSSLTVIARVAGQRALTPGDVVAASGVADPLAGSTVPLATVQLADAESHNGIVGVVARRMALVPTPWYEGEPDEAPMPELRIADGAAQPGDYVALTVLGVAMVKVEAGTAIQPGQRLVASAAPGRARALRTVEMDGVRLAEDAPTVGVALAAPAPGEDAIPVFVTLR